ncbi:hypothetical protein [Kitasatospora sp. NPDC057198]|uniref:hypothetical protein n=1 Tax=Kitasatospora sp. NPDC057198 TaxID=3346046 RepID=UPI003641FB43
MGQPELAGALSRDGLPLVLAARWVLDGRTPRRHQTRYTAFLDAVDDEFTTAGITTAFGHRDYANRNLLPAWLGDVALGHTPQVATERLIRVECEDRGGQSERGRKFASVLQGAADAWTRMLQGVLIANDGEIVAIFHEDELNLGYELRDVFRTVLPCARLRTDDFSWIAGRVPAVLGLFLAEHREGPIGLVLERESAHLFDLAACVLFLRNAVTLLGAPALAAFVEGDPGGLAGAAAGRALPPSGLGMQCTGFSTGFDGHALTRADLLPALRAAYAGRELPAPRRSGRSRRA